MSQYSLISADSHVVESPDLWKKWLQPEFLDRAPKLVKDSAGGDAREKSGEIFLLLGAEILSVGECGAHDSVNIALVALLALEPLDVGLRLVAGFSACRPDDGVQRSVHVLRHARGVAAHVKVRAGFEP